MKLSNLVADWYGKTVSFFKGRGPRLSSSSLFRGRIQAALVTWQERRQGILPDDQSYTFAARRYSGSRTRRYLVHAPHGHNNSRARPLVMVLHGCRQDNHDIEQISGFNELADRHGFLVVYPFVTSYRGLRNENCWGWWFDREIHQGAGEVEDLWQIIEEVKLNYAVDSQRIHVTGLSSGAAMVVAMMVAHNDKIASGTAVAGLPYAERSEAVRHSFNRHPRFRSIPTIVKSMKVEMGDCTRLVPLQIVHSHNDQTVEIQSAYNLRDSWGQCFKIDTNEPVKITSGQVANTAWQNSLYLDGGRKSVIETLFLEGPGHGWYGGNAGAFSFPEAPDIKSFIWDFFNAHPLPK